MTPMQSTFIFSLAATAMFITVLLFEMLALKIARKRFKVVIHVNGTRGKSTVTRMVHAVLRETGYKVWGKTTGTEPRLLLPDGTERLIHRIAPANVREQRNMFLRAALAGADALVFECNAVRPELQLVSSAFLRPDLVVITNARLDHRPEQGTAEDAARAFAATIPAGGAVATSDTAHRELWQAVAAGQGARCHFVDPDQGEGLGDLPENVACALAAADWLGLSRERAATAITAHRADPGVFRLLSWPNPGGGRTWYADASAANDPESTGRLAELARTRAAAEGMNLASLDGKRGASRVLVVASRPDRPDRTLMFAEYAIATCRHSGSGLECRYDESVFLGALPLRALIAVRRSGISYRSVRRLQKLEQTSAGDRFIVAAGNRGGPGKALHAWALAQAGKQAHP